MHKRNPNRIVFATESNALNAFDFWMDVLDRPWKIGDFVWTSFDYIGESSIGWLGYPQDTNFFPWNHAYCGDLDICGFKRPQSYYRDVLWKNGQQLSVFVKPPVPTFPETNPKLINWSNWNWHDVVADWNWPGYENKPIGLEIYCGYEQVELFLNGKSLGKKETNRSNKWIATFEVPYQPGEIKTIAYTGTKAVETSVLKTALKAEAIKLTADRYTIKPDGNDLCYVTVELIDSKGVRNPKAENLIRFEIDGAGIITAVGSSNPKSTESFQLPRRKAYQGRCLVIVKSSGKAGKIKLIAKSEGFKDAILNIQLLDK
jgi:beta-galactosidase